MLTPLKKKRKSLYLKNSKRLRVYNDAWVILVTSILLTQTKRLMLKQISYCNENTLNALKYIYILIKIFHKAHKNNTVTKLVLFLPRRNKTFSLTLH